MSLPTGRQLFSHVWSEFKRFAPMVRELDPRRVLARSRSAPVRARTPPDLSLTSLAPFLVFRRHRQSARAASAASCTTTE